MTQRYRIGRRIVAAALAAASLGAGFAAKAESHALILWIGEYTDPRANLSGIDLDARHARAIALAMGVPAPNIVELKNRELTRPGMASAVRALADRIKDGDNVFMYYSGHGAQVAAIPGASKKCSEGIVAQDLDLYFDQEIDTQLGRLAAKAREVVFMNDSCFSGGASEKGFPAPGAPMPKFLPFPASLKAGTSQGTPDRECGDAVNKGLLAKNFEVAKPNGARLLYIAAAKDDEVSWATAGGSLATRAWAACLAKPATDTDRSGSISGEELRRCAQDMINTDASGKRQTITLTGTSGLPLSFVSADHRQAGAPLNAAKTLEDIRVGADPFYQVKLVPVADSLRIRHDKLAFSVETDRQGYLYIFQIGSDGKTFNLIFPNELDADNRVSRGLHSFPRDTWQITATGPAGKSYMMALLSATPKNFSARMGRAGPFASMPATLEGAKNLVVSSSGAGATDGRFGASPIVSVEEVP